MFSRKSQKLNFVLLVLILSSIFFAIPLVYGAEYVAVPSSDGESGNKGNLTGPAAAVVTVLAWIIYPFAYAAGLLLTFLIWMFIEVIQYNHFIDVDTVIKGWVIIRDLCNMFFVLILLTIAFATILRVESYQLKKILPKLIIAAVLINFSRTIFGLIIDFGQVVMMTFVSGFAQFGANEFVKAFQINEYLSFANTHISTEGVGVLATLGALIAGFAALLITLVVVIVFLAIIVMRIIMLWVYTILSPLVFLGHAFPAAQKYTQQIWSDFIKQVVTGPLLAFFVWLALTTAQPSAQELQNSWAGYNPFGSGNANFQDQLQQERSKVSGALSSIFTANNFQRYIIVIALLIGGLMVTQQMGGFAGQMAGKGMGWIQSGKGLRGMTTIADFINRKQDKGFQFGKWKVPGTGIDFNLARVGKTLKAKWGDQKQKDLLDMQQRSGEVMATKNRFWGALAMTGNVGDAWDKISTFKGIKHIMMGGASLEEKNKEYAKKIRKAEEEKKPLERDRQNFWNKEEHESAKRRTKELSDEIEFLDSDIRKQKADISDERNKAAPDLRKIQNTQSLIHNLEKQYAEKDKEITELTEHMSRWSSEEDENATAIDKDISERNRNIKILREKASEYAPMYQFEARAAERKAVSEEKSKIKDIDDSDELVRMLRDSIRQRDKTRVKALVEKLTEDANDNEFTEALVPWEGSGYEGVHQLMDALSGKIDAQYEAELRKKYEGKGYSDSATNDYLKHLRSLNAGFSEQEAYSLGAQVAETNKRTNHWEATAAYVVDNGKFRKTTDEEHVLIASTEFGKRNPQANQRDNNRLAYGKHFYDPEGNKQYNMTKIGVIMLQSYDNDRTINRTGENMNESAAKFLTPYAQKMEEQGMLKRTDEKGKTLSTRMEEKANQALINFGVRYQTISDQLNNLLK